MNRLWSQVENSQQLAPLPRKAAMVQNKDDQHLAAHQNELSQSSMKWSMEVSNTAVWSGMGVFVLAIVAFIAFLIKKGKPTGTCDDVDRNDNRKESHALIL